MGIIELLLIAVGLSMDAFAVALCKGLNMKKLNYNNSIIIALFFGGFQALMPFLGWILGSQFNQYISEFDHWVAFLLLIFIGGKMLLEAMNTCDEKLEVDEGLNMKELFILAIATSIDALAVGITFAFLKVNIISSVLLIGVTTFILSFGGVVIGNYFGVKFKKRAEISGGVILIILGIHILLEHLGMLVF